VTTEISKVQNTALDGFDGYEERIEGDDGEARGPRVKQGEKLHFAEDFKWKNESDEEIPPEAKFTVVDICRVIQKRVDGVVVEGSTRFIPPGDPIPNIKKMNAECPASEWVTRFGKDVGPWQYMVVVYMVNADMKKFCFTTANTGGNICVGELADQVRNKRKIYGERVYPVVSLSKCWMNTAYGGRDRPSFVVKEWIVFGDGGKVLPEQPSPPTLPPAAATAATPAETPVPKGARVVSQEEANAKELNDSIPF
jgi:hypothetical protein